jgi:hypothetical protein
MNIDGLESFIDESIRVAKAATIYGSAPFRRPRLQDEHASLRMGAAKYKRRAQVPAGFGV